MYFLSGKKLVDKSVDIVDKIATSTQTREKGIYSGSTLK
jgi:hypothetical protein